jgi:hypothetical protein
MFDLFRPEREAVPSAPARRVVLIRPAEGLLECTLSTSVRAFAGEHRAFGRFLLSLRVVHAPLPL